MMDVSEQLRATARALERWVSGEGLELLSRAARMVASSIRGGGKLMLCGNGGSAADCQHVAAEFTCRLSKRLERPPMGALALTTDTSFLTACSNDYSFDLVFSRQVRALGLRGDVLMGISTGGSSRNVVLALEEARSMGISTIALTRSGGAIASMADLALEVEDSDTAVIQNVHLALEHALCFLVEDLLFGGDGAC